MAKTVTTKFGTKIDVSGLNPDQVKQVLSAAQDNGAYGAKGTALANQLRKGGGGTTGATNPNTGQVQTASEGTVTGDTRGNAANASGVFNNLLQGAYAGLTDPNAPPSAYQTSLYNQLTQGFAPQQSQDKEQLGQTLANRGIPVGSEAYKNEMNRFDQNWNQKYSTAQNQAVTDNVTATNQGLQTLGSYGTGIFNTITGKQIAANNAANAKAIANAGRGGRGAPSGGSNLGPQTGGAFDTPPPGSF